MEEDCFSCLSHHIDEDDEILVLFKEDCHPVILAFGDLRIGLSMSRDSFSAKINRHGGVWSMLVEGGWIR